MTARDNLLAALERHDRQVADFPEVKVMADDLREVVGFDYVSESLRTINAGWHGNLVSRNEWHYRLTKAIEALSNLDKIKKSFFYGRAYLLFQAETGIGDCANITEAIGNFGNGERVLHGILGIATEAGELLEALANGAHDAVNLKEEVGDLFWYCAILAHACNFTFDDAMRTNIGKLKVRFPERFTEEAANQRDLPAERDFLESGPQFTYPQTLMGGGLGNAGDSESVTAKVIPGGTVLSGTIGRGGDGTFESRGLNPMEVANYVQFDEDMKPGTIIFQSNEPGAFEFVVPPGVTNVEVFGVGGDASKAGSVTIRAIEPEPELQERHTLWDMARSAEAKAAEGLPGHVIGGGKPEDKG
jgi:NTP pyrophosphatase (non-canonical NTP hydrolase)